jgi:hypothetical protein
MFPDGDRLIRRWDPSAIGRRATFVFYLLLGGSIAAAIRSAGVLMVFTYLVAPALAIRILGVERGAGSVAVVTAAACGVFGLWGSYRWDLPSGSAIVAAFGFWLALVAGVAGFMRRSASGSGETEPPVARPISERGRLPGAGRTRP